ncbi:hypothetical protein AB0B56_07785 [Streptosporangium canum]|uniref:hypothetical protein n=1 Tax=Streptosporangium canum TaxID=324952 RepID=UPI003441B1C3
MLRFFPEKEKELVSHDRVAVIVSEDAIVAAFRRRTWLSAARRHDRAAPLVTWSVRKP